MSAIDPILPQPPTMAAVSAASRANGVDPDGRQSAADERERRRREARNGAEPAIALDVDGAADGVDRPFEDGDDDPRPHVDITV